MADPTVEDIHRILKKAARGYAAPEIMPTIQEIPTAGPDRARRFQLIFAEGSAIDVTIRQIRVCDVCKKALTFEKPCRILNAYLLCGTCNPPGT